MLVKLSTLLIIVEVPSTVGFNYFFIDTTSLIHPFYLSTNGTKEYPPLTSSVCRVAIRRQKQGHMIVLPSLHKKSYLDFGKEGIVNSKIRARIEFDLPNTRCVLPLKILRDN